MNKRQRKKIIKKYGDSFWKIGSETESECSYALIFPPRWRKDRKIRNEYHEMKYNKIDHKYYYKIVIPQKEMLFVYVEDVISSEDYKIIHP